MFKKRLILGLALIGTCKQGAAAVSASYEMDGYVEQKYIRKGEWDMITNWFQVAVSGARSTIRTGGMTDKAVDYFEYVNDGTNSEMLIKYNPPDPLSARKPINQASVIINSGAVPEYGFGLITPVWLACASSHFFHSAGKQIEPIFYMGLGVRKHHLKVNAKWSLVAERPRLPEWMCDFSDGNTYNEENRALIVKKLPAPFDKPTTNSVYSVLSWTKVDDLHLPLEWRVIQYRPNLESQTLESKIISTGHTTVVRSGTSRDSFEIHAPEYSRVTDRTLEAQGVAVPEYTYLTTNGDLLPLSEIKKQIGFAPILAAGERRVPVHASDRRLIVLAAIFIILCVLAVVLLWRWRQGVQES